MLVRAPILWLGRVVDDLTILSNPAVSPAANRWQRGLAGAIRNAGYDVLHAGHIPERAWPKGRWHVQDRSDTAIGVSYLNLPYLRAVDTWRGYRGAIRRAREFLSGERLRAVVTYNVTGPQAFACLELQESTGTPWICILADGAVSRVGKRLQELVLRNAAGVVYLSWHSYVHSEIRHRIHIDGGVQAIRFSPRDDLNVHVVPGSVLFAGAMSKFAGVEMLVRSFSGIQSQDARLWLCGNGFSSAAESAAQTDPRIRTYGLLPEAELRALSQSAAVFANPRPIAQRGNESNFPSKVLEYFSYGKPVVSTWTPGLSPEYRDLLVASSDDTPEAFRRALLDAMNWDRPTLDSYQERLFEFLRKSRSWEVQAHRFMAWLEALPN